MNKELEGIKKRIRGAGRILKLTAAKSNLAAAPLKGLLTPEHVWPTRLRVKMGSGGWRSFKAYRVQHSRRRGPYKGGIRFHPQVSLALLKALALEMSLKTAVVGLPLGGSKGGVAVDPKKLTVWELEGLSREYVRHFYQHLGPYQDIPAPDVGTNEKVMGWMVSEFARQTRSRKYEVIGRKYELGSRNYGGKSGKLTEGEIQAAFTGKPVAAGGSEGRAEATGRGGLIVLREILKQVQDDAGTLSVAVQGLGNVGGVFARLADKAGFKVVAVADSRGGVVKVGRRKYKVTSREEEWGELDVKKLLKWKEEHGDLTGFPHVERITNEELLELPVDILVPAALGNVITAKNAGQIKAKLILELANGPTTPEADEILRRKGITVIPDILANAGGVTVSYFEWRQNLNGEHWPEERVNRELAEILVRAVRAVREMGERYKVDLRTAAYLLALKRLTAGKRLGG